MGMKNLMCEILADKQKEYIKSLSEQLKHKNELVIKESRRANEMFQLSYNRKLKIEEQQAEINRLRDLLKQCIPAAEFAKDKGLADMINKALNGESEGSGMMTKTFLAHITEMANKKLAAMEEEIVRQQAEINRLRTALENLIEAFLILKRFYPTTTLFADEHIKNINKALNGESEVKC